MRAESRDRGSAADSAGSPAPSRVPAPADRAWAARSCHRRRHRDVLVRHEPLAIAAFEARGAADPVARLVVRIARARDKREVVAERRALTRHHAQAVQLETEWSFERIEPVLEVVAIRGRA